MKPTFKISLKGLIIILFVILVVFSSGLTGYLSFKNGAKAVEEQSFLLRSEITLRIKDRVKEFLEKPITLNQTLVNSFDLGYLQVDDKVKLRKLYWKQIQLFKEVNQEAIGTEEGLCYGYTRRPDGSFWSHESDASTGFTLNHHNVDNQGNLLDIVVSSPNYDPRVRPWYTSAKKSGKPV